MTSAFSALLTICAGNSPVIGILCRRILFNRPPSYCLWYNYDKEFNLEVNQQHMCHPCIGCYHSNVIAGTVTRLHNHIPAIIFTRPPHLKLVNAITIMRCKEVYVKKYDGHSFNMMMSCQYKKIHFGNETICKIVLSLQWDFLNWEEKMTSWYWISS